jgi:aryl-alcohol dehydrogenase-like predicted oxidoreductase
MSFSYEDKRKPLVIPARLQEVANSAGYSIEVKALRHVRGWPTRSTKPFQLWLGDSFIASFATIEQLERNFRARAGR